MISCLSHTTVIPASGEGANINTGFCINRQADYTVGFIGYPIGIMKIFKYSICLSYFFLGLHFVTFFNLKPNSFNLFDIVLIVGNSSGEQFIFSINLRCTSFAVMGE